MELLLLNIGPPQSGGSSPAKLLADLCREHGLALTSVNDLDAGLVLLEHRRFEIVLVAQSTPGQPPLRDIVARLRLHRAALALLLQDPTEFAGLDQTSRAAVADFALAPFTRAALEPRLALIARRCRDDAMPQALLRALPDTMFRINRDGVYSDIHIPAAEVGALPMKPEEVIGSRLSALLPSDTARRVLTTITAAIDSDQPSYLEYELPMPDGTHYYEARVVRCSDDEALVLVRDVTNRRRAEEETRAAAKAKQAFASRVLSVQEAERQHLSRELHDSISQLVLVHRMDAEWLAQQSEPGPAREAAERMCSSLDDTLHLVRTLAMDLRPPAIDDLGIDSALQTLCADIARRSGVPCEFEGDPRLVGLSSEVGVALYRIAQEALSNAVRHAHCEHLQVALSRQSSAIELSVTDDGHGIPPAQLTDPTSFGLVGMRERAELIGGYVTIHTSPKDGTCIRATVPYKRHRATAVHRHPPTRQGEP